LSTRNTRRSAVFLEPTETWQMMPQLSFAPMSSMPLEHNCLQLNTATVLSCRHLLSSLTGLWNHSSYHRENHQLQGCRLRPPSPPASGRHESAHHNNLLQKGRNCCRIGASTSKLSGQPVTISDTLNGESSLQRTPLKVAYRSIESLCTLLQGKKQSQGYI
jgi:hypothetical protein